MKRVLFIAPTVGGFDKVIKSELERQEYEVDFIIEHFVTGDPLYVRDTHSYEDKYISDFYESLKPYWVEVLSSSSYNKSYDVLFVIDGRGLHHCIFDILKERNNDLYSVNYLYDTMRNIYRFDKQFHNFDRVITYDRQDQRDYKLEFLPICWNTQEGAPSNDYKVFGMGAYFASRDKLYRFVGDISKEKKYNSYIKLYSAPIKHYPFKYIANLILNKKTYLPPTLYYSDYILHSFMSNDQFNKVLNSSEIILDSIDSRQDGLTARCTWALGAEKKIITDNKSIKDYDFYTPEQIFVVEDFSDSTKKDLKLFMETTFVMKSENRQKIETFRIDNWVKFIMNK